MYKSYGYTLLLSAILAQASFGAITYSNGFSSVAAYTHTNSDSVVSFDWSGTGQLFYMTSSGYPDINVWRDNGGSPQAVYSEPSNYAGASVTAIGNYIYFNDSTGGGTQNIWKFGPTNGSPATSLISTAANSTIAGHNGDMFITGDGNGNFVNEHFYTALDGNGDLTGSIVNLGENFGSSGPIVFDALGDMYYAPGFGDKSIYKWTAAQVADAVAGTSTLPTSGVLWYDYSADFADQSGATGMAMDADGNLVVSITDFVNDSVLVQFGVDGIGDFDGGLTLMLSSNTRLGDVRNYNGDVYVSADNAVLQIIPEPGSTGLIFGLLAGLSVMAIRRRK